MIARFGLGLVACVLVAGWIGTADAQRYVIVNGQRLSAPQISALERMSCGAIPNGNYWLNTQTGIWGYAGNPRPAGHIKDNCRRGSRSQGRNQRQGRRKSLSERGLLYSPGELLR